MTIGSRWFLMMTLPVALTLAACGGKSGLAGRSDASRGDAPTSDTAVGAAKLTVSPPSVDFGVFDWGTTPAPAVVTVTNTGTASSGPISVVVTGPNISAIGCAGTPLAPQASCTISITTQPTTAGRFDGTVEVDDGSGHPRKIPVAGIAWRSGTLSLSPSPLDLGSVTTGQTVSGTIVARNTTIADMTDVIINVSGAGFSRSPAGTCTDILAMDQSCTIVVSYTAGSTPGLAKGTVTVSFGGVTKPVPVTAIVTPCELPTISASNTDFGSVVVGSASTPLSFTIVNPSTQDAPMQISVDEPQFVFAFDGCSGEALESGQPCSFSVQFKPAWGDAGIIHGRLKAVFGSGPCSTAYLDVTGTAIPVGAMDAGVAEAGLSRVEVSLPYPKDALDPDTPSPLPPGSATFVVSPGSIDLGAVDVGATSPPATVTVTNVGALDSAPMYVTVDGAGISVSGCIGTPLAPQGACTLTVRVYPVVAGVISGTVKVGDGPSNFREIPVKGLAVSPGQMLSLSTNNLDLGPVLTGKTALGTIVMSNNAQGNATGIVINVAGTGFGLLPSGTCTDTLAVGQTCDIDVGFAAGPSSGPAKGTVVVNVGGRSMAVALSATVQAPAKLIMTPPFASFTTTTGTPSSPLSFYVTNAGDVSSAIPSVSISGPDKDDFSFTTTCATAMPAGATASCQITVVYTPKTSRTSNASATLTVAESLSGGSSVTATLTGLAVSP